MVLLLTAAALVAAGAPSNTAVAALQQDCTASEPGVRVNVSGLRDRSGKLKLELYPATPADFLQDDEALLKAGKTFRRIVTFVPSRLTSLCVPVPGPGRYAVIVIHKRDGASKFSVANDGIAVPGSDRIGLRKPTVGEATVVVADHVTTVDARMQYLRGLSGCKPMVR